MADLSDIQSASIVKIVGSDAVGVEQTPIQSTPSGGLHVNLRDSSGNEITSIGGGSGGTQYADGSPRGTATGNLVMGDDGTNIQAISAKLLSTQLAASDTGLVVNSVIHALTTGGGGGYVDVKANPSGALTVEVNADQTDSYAPVTPYNIIGSVSPIVDGDRQLIVRGDVLTDEGTFRDDFTGIALNPNLWTFASAGGGASITVGSSLVNIITGNGNGATNYIQSDGDYGPISLRCQATLSNRSTAQNIDLGFKNTFIGTAEQTAFFRFSGTVNTVISCITSSSSAATDQQTTTVTIPNGTSANSNDYYIEVQSDQVTFIINGIQVAQHRLHIPGPYNVLNVGAYTLNTSGAASTSTLSIDYIYFINQNSLQVNNSFIGDDLPVRIKTNTIQTYGASIIGLTAQNNATDIFTITGSATKTVKIKSITIVGTQTNASTTNILLLKRSTANTGGTITTLTAVPFDSFNQNATAVVRAYSTNPTGLGTLVGAFHNKRLYIGTATGVGITDELSFSTSVNLTAQEMTLRGTNEVMAVNLNGATIAGNSFSIDILWTEE